jgi:propanol-preferring alcohol dehydrogenase
MSAWAIVEHEAPLQKIEREDLVPEGTEVVLDVEYAGVCHSDVHFWHGYYDMGGGRRLNMSERGVKLPRAPGHEIVGRVSRVGPLVRDVRVGEMKIVYPWLGCNDCARCRDGEENLCSKPHGIGILHDGGFGDEVMVPHPKYLVDVQGIDPAFASTLACSGITVYSAIRKIQPMPPDDPVVLIGAGGLGLQAISILRALGHRRIISVDLNDEKRAAALEMGASEAIDGAAEGLAERIMATAGGLVGAVIDFVNIGSTAEAGMECLAKGGKLVLVGVGGGQIVLSSVGMIYRPRSIMGTVTGTVKELQELADLARSGAIQPIPIVLMEKDQANEALGLLGGGKVRGRIVLRSRQAATGGDRAVGP